MMKRMLLGSTAALAMFLAMGVAAQSADIATEPVAATDWNGFYAGVHAGYGWANMSGCYDCNDTESALDAEDLDLDGMIAGLQAGYNWQIDNFVLGVEGDVTVTGFEDVTVAPDGFEEQTGKVDLLASVRARLGVAFDDVLLYATGGIAIPDASWEETGNGGGGVDFEKIGGVAGAGVEYAATEMMRFRAEGLYYFLDQKESLEDVDDADDGEEIELEDAFVVRAGVSFYFR